ncbi:SPASM domain-containing protein [Candidatus Merdisoma sp. JLR.KK011]|uniref:SPASM domain-containing protein n=1 Tax=Candidatus Merdisoma sp. JLR.KK011 TaxID=3114299 RepID=UPI002FF1CF22
MKKNVIFGAGSYGLQALKKLGREQTAYFLDNDKEKQGTSFQGLPVISAEEFLPMKEQYHVVIASRLYAGNMERQLLEAGVADYSFFLKEFLRFYETEELIYNPYEAVPEVGTEAEWNKSRRQELARKAVYEETEFLYEKQGLFNHIEIETINRCNGSCSFCPVNCKVDPREKKVMEKDLFEKIVEELAGMDYAGRFTTFSNNEPLLDERIIDFNHYARKRLPKARMHLFTNGTLLTLDKFKALTEVLDELIIDNYQQELKLIKPCREVAEYAKQHPEIAKKVTIVLRKPHEILTSRGGTAPNRREMEDYGKERCVLPFKQLIVRPDGKISLCCNDAVGAYTLGDLTKESILDVWYGEAFQKVRRCLYEGRENWGKCRYCDAFSMG